MIQRAIACPKIEFVKKDCIRKLNEIDNNIISIQIKISIIFDLLIITPKTPRINKTTGNIIKFVMLFSV